MYLLIRRMTSGGSGSRMRRFGGGVWVGFDMQKANMVYTCQPAQQRFNFSNATNIFYKQTICFVSIRILTL